MEILAEILSFSLLTLPMYEIIYTIIRIYQVEFFTDNYFNFLWHIAVCLVVGSDVIMNLGSYIPIHFKFFVFRKCIKLNYQSDGFFNEKSNSVTWWTIELWGNDTQ